MKNGGGSTLSVTCPYKKHAFYISIDSLGKFELEGICPKPDLTGYYIPSWGMDLELEYAVEKPYIEVVNAFLKSKSFHSVMVDVKSGEFYEVVQKVKLVDIILYHY